MSHKQKACRPHIQPGEPAAGGTAQPAGQPEPDLPPIQAIPMTDGTPAACMQKKTPGNFWQEIHPG